MTYIYEDTGKPIPEYDREEVWLCEDCNWELMNGYPMDEDHYDILEDRAEREYAEDPINNTPPWLEAIE